MTLAKSEDLPIESGAVPFQPGVKQELWDWRYSMRAICPGTQSKGLGFGKKSLQVILQEAYQAVIKNIQVQSSSIFIC